jgi:glycosyltransferase involved in cell wall biosynthesis
VIQISVGKIPSGVDAFIVVSRFSKMILKPYLPERTPVFQVANPIDVEQGKPVDVANNRSLVMVGRITIDKGAILLARTARECGAPVVFVGGGRSVADVVSANPSAVITGWLSRAEVQKHLRAARALVFPSLLYETQGIVVPEAAAMGIPAIVSDTSAAIEAVRDGVTGLLFRNGDSRSLAQAIGRLSNDTLVRQLGVAAYNTYWSAPSTLELHVKVLEDVYEYVLRNASTGRS